MKQNQITDCNFINIYDANQCDHRRCVQSTYVRLPHQMLTAFRSNQLVLSSHNIVTFLLHITHHISHITHHISHITYHIAYITEHIRISARHAMGYYLLYGISSNIQLLATYNKLKNIHTSDRCDDRLYDLWNTKYSLRTSFQS